ncbi:hypothetical protein LZC95_48035 [Pendulispora brunnea]|uniref:Uncharacterized protein n=1 Tax=Pendulispora brunnea TaxID=2905690 RepID=A0ABZ2K663_9BACT
MQRYRSRSLLSAFVLSFSAACSLPPDHPEETTGDIGQPLRVTPPSVAGGAVLGSGYAVDRRAFTGTCLSGEVRYAGGSSGGLGLTRVDGAWQLASDVGVEEGPAAFAPAMDNLAARFVTTAESTASRQSVTYGYRVQGKSAVLVNGVPTQAALDAKAEGAEAVKQACGTEFVSEVQLGAGLWVNVGVDYLDRSAMDAFRRSLEAKVRAGFESGEAFHLEEPGSAKSAHVTISAYQLGGDPKKLGSMFAQSQCQTGDNVPADSSGVAKKCIATTTCSLSAPQDCNDALARVRGYAYTSFPKQIENLSYDIHAPTGAAVLAYVTRSYREAGYSNIVDEESPVTPPGVASARVQLHQRLRDLARDRARVETLLGTAFRLTSEERTAFDATHRNILNQMVETGRVLRTCYSRLGECEAAETALAERFKGPDYRYDLESLVKAPGFFEYCSGFEPSVESTKTLDAIRDQLGARGLSCEMAADKLAVATSLDLHAKGLVDIRPLRGATSLQALNLRQNQLRSLASFPALPRLARLNVAYNRLVNVEPLTALPALVSVKIQGNNEIEDLSPLDRIPTLQTKIKTDADVCRLERAEVLAAGMISDQEYAIYERRNWGPDYNRTGDRGSGIDLWIPCARVAPDLPAGLAP